MSYIDPTRESNDVYPVDLDEEPQTKCIHCEMKGADEDGEQLHWKDCPTLKDPSDEADANYQETATV